MLGRNLTALRPGVAAQVESGGWRGRCSGRMAPAAARRTFRIVLHAGEVVGLAGLLGSGRTEIANLLFGIDRPTVGTRD